MAVTAEGAGFAAQIWLGKERFAWPVVVFASELEATDWSAAQDSPQRHIIGPINVPLDLETRVAVTIPAHYVLREG